MQALCWNGVDELDVETVPDPSIVNPRDALLRVRMSTACGSDLHFIHGHVPTMRQGDVIGHEFVAEVVAAGPKVDGLEEGDRVVVPSFIACGNCAQCEDERYSLCDNSNPHPELQEPLMGYPTGGVYGYTHAFGGYAGAHAEYVRVPYADRNCFHVPEQLDDEQALFVSDAWPTGYMGAEFCEPEPDDTIAVWGLGGVGLAAAESAKLQGAGRVIGIDRFPERLRMAEEEAGVETIDYTETDSVVDALREATGGRGPDACIDAVGMEAHGEGLEHTYDEVKQRLKLHSDRASALREAIRACGKGGTLSILGVYGMVDKFPMGAIQNKDLTVRSAQQHGQRYVPKLLEHVVNGEMDPSYMATHRFDLADAAEGYRMFARKEDGCVRPVFTPNGG